MQKTILSYHIIMQLPSFICAHQTVNYTITITDDIMNQSNYLMNMNYISYGPYFHLGPGVVSCDITSGLDRNKEYSAIVNVGIGPQMIQSHKVLFSKLLIT